MPSLESFVLTTWLLWLYLLYKQQNHRTYRLCWVDQDTRQLLCRWTISLLSNTHFEIVIKNNVIRSNLIEWSYIFNNHMLILKHVNLYHLKWYREYLYAKNPSKEIRKATQHGGSSDHDLHWDFDLPLIYMLLGVRSPVSLPPFVLLLDFDSFPVVNLVVFYPKSPVSISPWR